MSETDAVTKVARDLSSIVDLSAALEAQAIAKANSPDHLPGGAAMVALGPVASHEAWVNTFDTAERLGRDTTYISDDDEDWAPPLQLLLFWSEALRIEQGQDYGQRPTIQSEASYLKFALEHLWQNEPRFEDFAKDVAKARTSLENTLHAGTRELRGRVTCDHQDCERKPRLIRVYRKDAEDVWKCPSCQWFYDEQAYRNMRESQARSQAAEKFVSVREAIDLLRAQGTGANIARRWLAPPKLEHVADRCTVCKRKCEPQEYPSCPRILKSGEECGGMLEPVRTGNPEAVVKGYCDIFTRAQMVWWPDLWTKHLSRPMRVLRKEDAA